MRALTSKQADLMLFFVAFFWGTGFAVTKIALDIYSTVQLLFIRFIIASIVSLIIFNKNIRNMNRSDLKSGVIMGVFLAAGYIFQTFGLEGTTAGNSAFLTGTNVVMVPFFYWIITKKKPVFNNLIAAILMFIGIILLTVDFKNFGKFNLSDMLTFFCAISFAWHVVVTGIFASDKNPYTISTIQMTTCAVIFLIMMILEGKPITYNFKGALSMGYLSLITTMLCFMMQTIGQKYTSTTHAAIVLSLESVIGSIFGVLFLKENYTIITILAFVIIFISILFAEVGYDWLFRTKKNRLPDKK
ncbi:DMT family transporter [Sedimentibacter sp. MB31-C6]|uniref:DMT family transporter n=1 Tax=Sedimentibacter sp. MB31-C6 TaxID=3109366 RepID=UPI002DDD466E|nr:DMT family transporter [Sedimentibacter sp. MB36-C1]WSI03978.1 DMT family transporter [Sedimentibacter sp. MB36-C1]